MAETHGTNISPFAIQICIPMNNSNNLEILPRRQIDSIEYGNFSLFLTLFLNLSPVHSHSVPRCSLSLSLCPFFVSHFHKSLSKSCNISFGIEGGKSFRQRFITSIHLISCTHKHTHTNVHRAPVISYTPHFVCLPHHIAHANG